MKEESLEALVMQHVQHINEIKRDQKQKMPNIKAEIANLQVKEVFFGCFNMMRMKSHKNKKNIRDCSQITLLRNGCQKNRKKA